MANEAVLVFETGLPIPFTVADGTGIEKGALCKMTDPFTAIITSAASDQVAGIAASEKIADDGKVKLGIYREGIFKMTLSGTVSAGHAVATGAIVNVITAAGVSLSGSSVLGLALETGTEGETILVELKPGVSSNVS